MIIWGADGLLLYISFRRPIRNPQDKPPGKARRRLVRALSAFLRCIRSGCTRRLDCRVPFLLGDVDTLIINALGGGFLFLIDPLSDLNLLVHADDRIRRARLDGRSCTLRPAGRCHSGSADQQRGNNRFR
jgi:hypothetical protein